VESSGDVTGVRQRSLSSCATRSYEPRRPKDGGLHRVLREALDRGPLRLIATIEDPTVVRRILSHLRIPTERPEPLPARSPPGLAAPFDLLLDGEFLTEH
jgi:hypothetical protein